MKFTADQIIFLMTKMTIEDVSVFKQEASEFKIEKTPEEKCTGVLKNGSVCSKRGRYDGMCGRHKIGRTVPVKSTVPDYKKCCVIKTNGDRCNLLGKFENHCHVHKNLIEQPPSLVDKPLSEEFIVDSDEE